MKVLGISGSLRRDSYNTKLLRAAEELLPAGVEFERYQGLKAIPPYDEEDDVQPAPPAVADLREAIAEADATSRVVVVPLDALPGALEHAVGGAEHL